MGSSQGRRRAASFTLKQALKTPGPFVTDSSVCVGRTAYVPSYAGPETVLKQDWELLCLVAIINLTGGLPPRTSPHPPVTAVTADSVPSANIEGNRARCTYE